MAYQANIPQPTDKKSVSQGDILANFTALNTVFAVDHVTFDAVSRNGIHTYVTLGLQSDPAVPSDQLQSPEIALYAKNDTKTSATELYYKQSGGNVFNITGGKRNTTGWSYIGYGIVMAWGSGSSTDATGLKQISPSQYTFSTIYSVQITTWLQGTSPADQLARLKSIDAGNNFTVFCSTLAGVAANSVGFQWLAIGV